MKVMRLVGAAFLLAILLSANIGLAQSKFKLRKVVGTGDNAPVPQQLSDINSFSFNSHGQQAFIGDGGLFLNSAGTNTIIAGFGDAAPGGGSFISVSSPSINSSGQIVFRGETNFPSPSGLFLFSGGKITQLVADGTFTGTDVVFPDNPSSNDTGAVAFVSFIGNGLFLDVNGTITKIAGPGDPAPGGDFFSGFSSPAINHAGQIVFTAFLTSGSQGIFLASRSEEHTSELQSRQYLVCRLLLEKKKKI